MSKKPRTSRNLLTLQGGEGHLDHEYDEESDAFAWHPTHVPDGADVDGARECSRCGARCYWPAASVACPAPGPVGRDTVTGPLFKSHIEIEVASFLAQWSGPDLPLAEWWIELLEWRRSAAKKKKR